MTLFTLRLGSSMSWTLALNFLGHARIGKGSMNTGGTGGHQENALQDIGDTTGAVFRVALLDLDDTLLDDRAALGFRPGALLGQQPVRALLAIRLGPAGNRMMTDTEVLSLKAAGVSFLQVQPHHLQSELVRIGAGPRLGLPPSTIGSRSLNHGAHSFHFN